MIIKQICSIQGLGEEIRRNIGDLEVCEEHEGQECWSVCHSRNVLQTHSEVFVGCMATLQQWQNSMMSFNIIILSQQPNVHILLKDMDMSWWHHLALDDILEQDSISRTFSLSVPVWMCRMMSNLLQHLIQPLSVLWHLPMGWHSKMVKSKTNCHLGRQVNNWKKKHTAHKRQNKIKCPY